MALLLNIDTATGYAGICLSRGGEILAIEETEDQKNHATFIQPAIKRVMHCSGHALADIDAVAVTGGPGSYTGLRVGLSSAKGLCYALKKPLIMVNTLEVMAFAAIKQWQNERESLENVLFCPMIDARRMEVFAAIYDQQLNILMPPAAIILDESSFRDELSGHSIIFSGSGSTKAKIIKHQNAVFFEKRHNCSHLNALAQLRYNASSFADLAYSEPFYLKDFYKHVKKN